MKKMRLIDADNLILEINKLLESPYAKQSQFGAERREAIETVRDLCVKQESTAFDVDAVVTQLDEKIASLDNKNKICMDVGDFRSSDKYAERMCEVIKCKEIVKNAVTPAAVHEGEAE